MKTPLFRTICGRLLLSLVLALTLTACGGGGGSSGPTADTSTPTETSTPSPEAGNGDDTQPPTPDSGGTTETLSEVSLEELAYTGDLDPPPRDDVNVQIQDLDDQDRLTLATRADDGYQTHVVAAADMTQATAAGPFRVTAVSENSLTLSGDTSDLQAGDIIVGVADDGNYSPVLRRVVQAPDGTVVASDGTVLTEQARLEEAFPSADLSITLEAYNVENGTNLPAGLTLVDTNVRLLQFDRQVAHQFLPGLTTTGRFSMSSNFHIKLDLNWRLNVSEARVVLSADPRALARVDVNLPPTAIANTWNKEFRPIFNRSRTFFIYGIPVPLNLKVTPELAAKAEVGGQFNATFGLDVRARASGGFTYTNNSGFSLVQQFTPTLRRIGPTYQVDAGGLVRGEANMKVMLSVFEASINMPVFGRISLDGPGVGTNVGPYAQFKVTASTGTQGPTTCLADLSVGLHADLIADLGPVARVIDANNIAATINGVTVSNGGQELSVTLYETGYSLWSENFDCGAEPGKLGGHVADARDGTSLPEVLVTARNDDGEQFTTTTNSGGNYLFDELAPGPHTIIFAKAGYEPAQARVTVEGGQTTTLNQALLMEEQEEGATGTLVVTVKNARTNEPLPDTTVAVRTGLENRAGSVVEMGTTGPDGTISLRVPAGYYTVQAVREGFEAGYTSVTVRADDATPVPGGGQAQVILSPDEESAGEARIILTWGQNPRDLDSHLFGPCGHIAYYSMTAGNCSLDVDDTTSFGPETVTIAQVDPTGTYDYWVHHFAGEGTIATSGAQVTLQYNGLSYVFSAPAGAVSTWWHVFSIENGVVRGCSSACFASGGSRSGPAATAVRVSPAPGMVPPPVNDLPAK